MSFGTLSVRELLQQSANARGTFILIQFRIAGSQNSFLVKRKTDGSPQFSRDPLNLTNVHSRKVRRIRVPHEMIEG